ncbi:hypothetical protein HDV06_002779 [Boothiomyces sp. JEL0866]|nr:hypothetical protein HDV06_002779 [Boothiomyces sp. JEL0866]
MASLENSLALYAIQSHWLQSYCQTPPDLIIGTTNVTATIPFSPLVFTGISYCGEEFIYDCTHHGICMASLDLGMTFGFSGFQDSYLDLIPTSPSQWLFPTTANGNNYCMVDQGENQSFLILSGSDICHYNFKCINNELRYYHDTLCTGSPTTYLLSSIPTALNISNIAYIGRIYTVTSGTESISWTTFITSLSTVLEQPEPLWVLSLLIVICSMMILFVHFSISAYKYSKTSRWKYLAFAIAFLISITECLVVVFASLQGMISLSYTNLLYGINSGFNFALNGLCLMEIVFRNTTQRIILGVILFTIYFILGSPYVFCLYFVNDEVSDVGIFLNFYFDTYAYPIWQIVCFAFDPITAITIIFYIIRISLISIQKSWYDTFLIVFNDQRLLWLSFISLVNFSSSVILQVLTTYTLFAQNDKMMIVYECIYALQHSVNICCTFWYSHYFPILLKRMLSIKQGTEDLKGEKGPSSKKLTDIIKMDSRKTAEAGKNEPRTIQGAATFKII